MAAYKPIRIGDSVPLQQISPSTETIDGKIQVTQTGVVLGRSSAGAGAHEEILFADLPGGGGASYTEITYADMATALTGGTLTPGGWYLITDAAGTDLGFLTYAVKENEISPAGVGGYLNADFQAVGDYSGVAAITGQAAGTQQGIWQAANEGGYVQGDIVIWNLLHWQLTDSGVIDGTDPATNVAAYTQLLKTDAGQGYVTAWDVSEFDFTNNWIQYRADLLGNRIRYEKTTDDNNAGYGFSIIHRFQFGRISWAFNDIENGWIDDINGLVIFQYNKMRANSAITSNVTGTGSVISLNTLNPGSYIYGVTLENSSQIYGNTFSENAYIENAVLLSSSFILDNSFLTGAAITESTINDAVRIQKNTISQGAIITALSIGANTLIENNILENGAQLTGITAGANCSISRNKIGQGATLGGSTTMGDGAVIDDNNLLSGASLSNINNNGSLSKNYFGVASYATLLDIAVSGRFETNIFGPEAGVEELEIQETGTFLGNIFASNSGATGVIGESSVCAQNIVDGGIAVSLSNGIEFGQNTIGKGVTISKSFSVNNTYKGTSPGIGSSFSEEIDITGLTTLDCLAENNYVGIFNLTSSNATEAIDTITNPPTLFPFTLRPAAGLVLTITGTAYAGIAAGQMSLNSDTVVLNGDNADYLILEFDPAGSGCLIEKGRRSAVTNTPSNFSPLLMIGI